MIEPSEDLLAKTELFSVSLEIFCIAVGQRKKQKNQWSQAIPEDLNL